LMIIATMHKANYVMTQIMLVMHGLAVD